MLDYIGGDIVHTTGNGTGHHLTLHIPVCRHGHSLNQRFFVRGVPPGQTGERVVVMLLDDEVVGWHNQATGMQGHLLHLQPWIRWRVRDLSIALASGLALTWVGGVLIGCAAGLGWLLSAALWRAYSMQRSQGELVDALYLSAGVTSPEDFLDKLGQP